MSEIKFYCVRCEHRLDWKQTREGSYLIHSCHNCENDNEQRALNALRKCQELKGRKKYKKNKIVIYLKLEGDEKE